MPRETSPLPVLLAKRARHSSDSRLVVDAGGGLLVAAIVIAWRPAWWILPASAALCFAAFGMWGITDRELHESLPPLRTARHHLLAALRACAATVGALAALLLIFGVLGLLLGTIIS